MIDHEFLDTRDDTTGRNRHTTFREIQAFRTTENIERFFDFWIIEKWFSHAHKNDVSKLKSFFFEMMDRDHNLLNNLSYC